MGGEEEKPEEKKPEPEKPAGDGEKKEDDAEKKKEEGGGEAKDSGKEEPPAPPPPPPEIVLRVYMHCEGCARKVKKCLRGFAGVEDVTTDCKSHTVVVKGEKADPMKVLERVQRKSHRHVELLSPIPKPPSEEEEAKKPEEAKEPPKEEKKEEPKVITVVLKVHMHCEACAQEIKKRIEKMKEVEIATPDLKNSEVIVKGTFDPPKLVDYIYRRTGKQAVVVKQEPEEVKEEGEKGKEGKEDDKKGENGEEEKKKGDGDESKEGGGGDGGGKAAEGGGGEAAEEEMKVVELHRNEFYHYPPKYGVPMYHTYPPQIFSDENPNACSIM